MLAAYGLTSDTPVRTALTTRSTSRPRSRKQPAIASEIPIFFRPVVLRNYQSSDITGTVLSPPQLTDREKRDHMTQGGIAVVMY